MLLSVQDVLQAGLRYVGVDLKSEMSRANRIVEFRKDYGSSDLDLASIWYDLTFTTIPGAKLSELEKRRGFKMFMVANNFLWTYPKNANTLASRFKMCVNYSKGAHLWIWVKRIAALKASKIKWDPKFGNPNAEVYIVTVDGTDYPC
jgi:hypothetical protein